MYSYHFKDRIYQGDIFKDIEINVAIEIVNSVIDVKQINFPYVVVMTQDCDLEQDFNNRKNSNKNQRNCLLSILLCPAFRSDDLKDGDHFKDIEMNCTGLNSSLWRPIRKNQDKRYHFLDKGNFEIPYKGMRAVPDLVVDFKHFHTFPRDEFYKLKSHYFVSIDPLFREEISDRFTHFLGRIGLPETKKDWGYCGTFCETN